MIHFQRPTVFAALAGAGATFVLMAALRPEPRTVFVTQDQTVIGNAALARVIPDFDVRNVPLRQAFAILAEQSHASIQVSEKSLEAAGIDVNKPVTLHLSDISVRNALRAMLRQQESGEAAVKLTYWNDDGQIQVTTREEADPSSATTKLYDVHALIRRMVGTELDWWPKDIQFDGQGSGLQSSRFSGPGPTNNLLTIEEAQDWLAELVRDCIDVGTWQENGGQIASLRMWGGHMIVTQTPENHDRIELLLNILCDAAEKTPTGPGMKRRATTTLLKSPTSP